MMFDMTSFLAGLLIGWLGEWVIDYLYWRKGGSDPEELAQFKEKLNVAETQVNELQVSLVSAQDESARWQTDYSAVQAKLAATEGTQDDLAQCRANNAALAAENAQLREDLDRALQETGIRAAAIDIGGEADDLALVPGIGPRFEEKLQAGGIYTFLMLAEASDDDLNRVIQPEPWQKVDYDGWRAAARVFAEVPPQQTAGDDLQQLEGIGPKYNQLLHEAGISTYAGLAASEPEQLAVIVSAPPWRSVNYDAWIAQARLAAAGDEAGLDALQEELYSRSGDKLVLIHGLGTSYNQALADAGISSYADLAGKSPTEIEAIVSAAELRHANYDAWIAEAKLRAAGKRIARVKREYEGAVMVSCPQDLEPIFGIGTVYEGRLYDAGIGSFWEVAQVEEEELGRILEVEEFQDVGLAEIRSSAMSLALETGTVNRVWDGTPPDDFEPMEGIGITYERRLYAAGYCTFEALAATTPQELERVCQPPDFNKPDFAQWIATAKSLAGSMGAGRE